MEAPLAGKAVLVTGPAKGMGPAICHAIALAGGDLVLVGRDRDALAALAAELAPHGRQVLIQPADVTSEAEVEAAAASALVTFGARFWGAVTVAGVSGPPGRKLWEHSVVDYHNVFGVNVLGTFLVLRAVLRGWSRQDRGAW